MRACMDENGMNFDEGEVDELTRALFHDATALTRRISQQQQQQQQQQQGEVEGHIAILGTHLATQVEYYSCSILVLVQAGSYSTTYIYSHTLSISLLFL